MPIHLFLCVLILVSFQSLRSQDTLTLKTGKVLIGSIIKETPRNFVITMDTPGEARKRFIEHSEISSVRDSGEPRRIKKFGKVKIRFNDGRPDLKLDFYSTTSNSLICYEYKTVFTADNEGKKNHHKQLHLLHFDVVDLEYIRWSKTSQAITVGTIVGATTGAMAAIIPLVILLPFDGDDWQWPAAYGAMGAGVGALWGLALADRVKIKFDEELGEWHEKRQRMPTGGLFE